MRVTARAAICCVASLIAAGAGLPAAAAAATSGSAMVAHAASCQNGPHLPISPDFNGDGNTDYVVGMPAAKDGEGGIEVVYGGGKAPQVITPGTDGVASVTAGAQFGASSAAVSVPGNTCDDLLVGIPDLTVDGLAGAGGVQVLIGSPTGFTAGPLITAGVGGAPGVPEANAHFGTSIALGNETRVVVGVPGATVMGGADGLTPLPQAGEIARFNLTSTGDVAPTGQSIQTMASGAQAGAHYGAVAAGEFASAPDASDGDKSDTGYVEIQGKGFFGRFAGDRLGVSMTLAPAESDADHVGELVAGAPGHDVAGHARAGAVEEFDFGIESNTLQRYDRTITQATKGVPGSPTTGAEFGAAVSGASGASGSAAEITIAAPGKTVDGTPGAGAIYVERVAETGHTAGDVPQGWSTITQAVHGVAGVPRRNAAFGYAMAAIRTDAIGNAGTTIFVVGIPGTHPAGKPASGAVETFPVSKSAIKTSGTKVLRRAGGPVSGDGFGGWLEGELDLVV